MSFSAEQLEPICRVARDASLRGVGDSLRDLIQKSGYEEMRPQLSQSVLAAYIMSHPELIRQWQLYSQDKRTSGGWYLLADHSGWEVGRFVAGQGRRDQQRFDSGTDACADYILRELDFWLTVQAT